MTTEGLILIVGGYGEVGRRLAAMLTPLHGDRVVVGGRNPERTAALRARRIDTGDPASVEAALDGVGTVVACVRQPEPHVLRAAVRRGIAYTSIAPPWMPWPTIEPLDAEARRTGARIVLAAGIEPGISSVLARLGADRLGGVDSVETALLLGVGDGYGPDSMEVLIGELAERYTIMIGGETNAARAFRRPARVTFPAPFGRRTAYTIPFRDQLYYPRTLGARTSIARVAIDPPWVGKLLSALTHLGVTALTRRRGGGGQRALHDVSARLRRRYAGHDQFALVVDVRSGARLVRSTLVGRRQADATAAGVAAITEALVAQEVDRPGVWLAEQVIAPDSFLARIAAHGLVPVTVESLDTGERAALHAA